MTINELYRIFLEKGGICTDTRKITEGCLFFALKGESYDANEFINEALEKGAGFCVTQNADFKPNSRCLVVEDTLKTLHKLATFHRQQFNIPIIALTGSNGKTTSKELLVRVLKTKYKVHATEGNLNNHFGVPFTLLGIKPETEIAVIEMGANHQGEIAELCKTAKPDFGFITNIGRAHLEGFGGPEGVKKGKGELLDYLKETGGIAFINETDSILMEMVDEKNMFTVVYFGNDEFALKMETAAPNIIFRSPTEKKSYPSHISGDYNFKNMQAAFNIGRYFNVEEKESCEALASYNPDNNRSQTVKVGSNTFLMDAYNANPSSMEAAIQNFSRLKTDGRKVVILGEMKELGEYSEAEHSKLGELLSKQKFGYIVFFGEEMRHALKHLPNAYYFTDKFSMHNWLLDMNFSDTYFLIKGSRSMNMESVLKAFQAVSNN